MYLIRFILLIAVGLLPVLPLAANGPAFSAETPSNCCGDACRCSVLSSCPCASSSENDRPTLPAIPSTDRVVIQQLFDRDPQPLFELDDADETGVLAIYEAQSAPPMRVGQRLSFLCLRVV